MLSAAVLSGGLLSTVPVPAAAAGADDCPGGRVLDFVAHNDDDVIFLSPDLVNDLGTPGVCVRTVFFIGAYYDRWGQRPTDADKQAYMQARELGTRDAYQKASGITGNWSHSAYSAGGVQATAWTLGRVSTINLQLPDDSASNDAGTMRKGQLWAVYANGTAAWTIPSEDAPQQRLSRDQLLGFVQALINDYQPTVINAMDPSADNQPVATGTGDTAFSNFHPDHLAAVRLLVGALNRRSGAWPRISFYRDYEAKYGSSNLDTVSANHKWQVFEAYALHDSEICAPGVTPCQYLTHDYDVYRTRQYYADSAWRKGYLLPLPYGSQDPRMDSRYRLVNRATSLYLDVSGSSGSDGTPVIGWPGTGNPNQVFVLSAAQGGWNLHPAFSGNCLDVPGSSRQPIGLIEYSCTANTDDPAQVQDTFRPNQAFRVQGDHTSGYQLTLAHSGLVLTAPATAGGQVTQDTDQGSPLQRWDLVPA